MRILIDIDAALVVTSPGGRRHSLPEAVAKAKALCKAHAVTLWSSRGLRYARAFARDNGLTGVRCIQKPDQIVSRL